MVNSRMGVLDFNDGERILGYNISSAYYAQHQLELLDVDKTVLDEMQMVAPDETKERLRTMLGAFLFTAEDAEKKVKVLSGGEKSRLISGERASPSACAIAVPDRTTRTLRTKADFELLRGQKVLIRAHGEPPATYALARQHGVTIIDATCPVVTKVQERIRKFYDQGYQIAIFGKKDHAEVIGLVGHTNNEAVVISSVEDVPQVDVSRKAQPAGWLLPSQFGHP
jgi:hypothetical protein